MPMGFDIGSPFAPKAGTCSDAMLCERLVVLRDLVALREVRIKVVLAREDTALVDRAAERLGRESRKLNGLPVQHRQSSGQAKAHGADVRVRLAAVLVLAAAEGLRLRQQLDVDLESDDRLIFGEDLGRETGKNRHKRILSTPASRLRPGLHLIRSVLRGR